MNQQANQSSIITADFNPTGQVGGNHYVADLQQWRWAAELNLRYFEGNITRYITRHGKKNGAEDLAKARHWAEELLKLHRAGVIHKPIVAYAFIAAMTNKLAIAYELTELEQDICERTARWQCEDDLIAIVAMINRLLEESY